MTNTTSSPTPASAGCCAPTRVHKVNGTEVQAFLWKLQIVLPFLPPLPLQILRDALGDGHRDDGKHAEQESSILGHLESVGALEPGDDGLEAAVIAIELGAGTGRLSDRLHRLTGGGMDHVLVDRKVFRPLALRDRRMRVRAEVAFGVHRDGKGLEEVVAAAARAPVVRRVVGDIAHFDFADVAGGGPGGARLCMSKHLCGPAFDHALAAVVRAGRSDPPRYCCLATCCHYLCTWETFAGRVFWAALGLDEGDFRVAAVVSQWASLRGGGGGGIASTRGQCRGRSRMLRPQRGRGGGGWLPVLSRVAEDAAAGLRSSPDPPPLVPSDRFERTFSREDKAALGKSAKDLLDYARAAELQRVLGYQVKLVRYTRRSIDDRLLVASMVSANHSQSRPGHVAGFISRN